MLTKNDKAEIGEIVDGKIRTAFDNFAKEIVKLFNATNETVEKKAEETNRKIEKVLDNLDKHNDYLNDHERRIEKLEEKVCSAS